MDNVRTSDSLVVGQVYTRNDLKELFNITDATINTGIFQPKNHRSIWLFITEDKTTDRTQYHDLLEKNSLTMQGQTSGRKDELIISHRESGLEIILFYRKRKYEFDKAGFRYEGNFSYESHYGEKPTTFLLNRIHSTGYSRTGELTLDAQTTKALENAQREAEASHAFDATSVEDQRKKVLANIVRRQGQPAFRKALLKAYEGKCAITDCSLTELLEAAHIHPYKGAHTNVVSNGLLLRADIHTLFDLGLINIDPDSLKVCISEKLVGTDYEYLQHRRIRSPSNKIDAPSYDALKWRLEL